jgi:putative hemolysin
MQAEVFSGPLSLNTQFGSSLSRRLFHIARPSVEKIIGLPQMNTVYEQACSIPNARSFFHAVLQVLSTSVRVTSGCTQSIPEHGPVVVVSNHPFGCIEGIALGAVLREQRPDVRLMANYLLGCIPELREYFFLVDPFGGTDAARANIRPIKDSLRWLKNGGLLGIFPAGEVAHYSTQTRNVEECSWNNSVARLVVSSNATVVPVWFDGSNGLAFQSLGMIHPRLRTAMLGREFLRMRNKTLQMSIGNPIPAERLTRLGSEADITDYLRTCTLSLGNRSDTAAAVARRRAAAVVLPCKPRLLREEIGQLDESHTLVECGDYVVYESGADAIPNVLHEIGRLREITFRGTGEGTGRSIDLDKFDKYYRHIFVWNRVRHEIVGAYRLGQTDIIRRFFGENGLYTSTLFGFDAKLLDRMQPALEMGRSFVRPEYQKAFQPLLLLWKGIGAFVVRNPQYKMLFGPVSITGDYQPLSRRLIASFLYQHHFLPEDAQSVRPRHPFIYPQADLHSMNLDDLSMLISDIEGGRRCVPVLLKQYLKLGGRILGFNIDPKFSNVLDGLIAVDLTKTDRKILQRYMGAESAAAFLAYHGVAPGRDNQPARSADHAAHGMPHSARFGRTIVPA